jgi:hypothetical protein
VNDKCSDCDHSGVGSLSTQLRASLDVSSADSGIPPPSPLVGRGMGGLLRSSTAADRSYHRQRGLERPDLEGDVCYAGLQTEKSESSVQRDRCVRNSGAGGQMCRLAACNRIPASIRVTLNKTLLCRPSPSWNTSTAVRSFLPKTGGRRHIGR